MRCYKQNRNLKFIVLKIIIICAVACPAALFSQTRIPIPFIDIAVRPATSEEVSLSLQILFPPDRSSRARTAGIHIRNRNHILRYFDIGAVTTRSFLSRNNRSGHFGDPFRRPDFAREGYFRSECRAAMALSCFQARSGHPPSSPAIRRHTDNRSR